MIATNAKYPGIVIVPVGTIDIDLNNATWKPNDEYFCKRKPDWLDVKRATNKFEGMF